MTFVKQNKLKKKRTERVTHSLSVAGSAENNGWFTTNDQYENGKQIKLLVHFVANAHIHVCQDV